MAISITDEKAFVFTKGMDGSTLTSVRVIRSSSYDEYFVIQEDLGSGEFSAKKFTSKDFFVRYGIDIKALLPNT